MLYALVRVSTKQKFNVTIKIIVVLRGDTHHNGGSIKPRSSKYISFLNKTQN